MSDTMKVTVNLTVEVSREGWSLAYGTENTAAAIRADVRSYVLNDVQSSAAAEENTILGAELR